MTRIIIDSELSKQLFGLNKVVEFCDESGQILGKFIPHVIVTITDATGNVVGQFRPTDWEPTSPEVSEEELDRRSRSGEKRYSTAEVLAHLENL